MSSSYWVSEWENEDVDYIWKDMLSSIERTGTLVVKTNPALTPHALSYVTLTSIQTGDECRIFADLGVFEYELTKKDLLSSPSKIWGYFTIPDWHPGGD